MITTFSPETSSPRPSPPSWSPAAGSSRNCSVRPSGGTSISYYDFRARRGSAWRLGVEHIRQARECCTQEYVHRYQLRPIRKGHRIYTEVVQDLRQTMCGLQGDRDELEVVPMQQLLGDGRFQHFLKTANEAVYTGA
ncbi:uncharacterized protein [Branchiostoma lanceolatum]|uniref:uncharacterized protein n=1 Tax=Branchiostoma lanceolatum TaxID=7740 RepID=UPI0034513665